jgi:5'-3' exonuclease
VQILTPDKDLGQCLRGDRVVLVDRMRSRVIDEDVLRKTRGVSPASVPDYLALVGDAADGIPGIAGFGAKTAAALLSAYGRLERIPQRASDWTVNLRGAPALAATLSANIDRALLYRRLATLDRAVPMPESLDDLRFRGVPLVKYEAWCDAIGASEGLRELGRRRANALASTDRGA